MQRIEAVAFSTEPAPWGNGGMTIEHFKSRAKFPREMYNWRNLVGVCGGWYKTPAMSRALEFCDSARGSTPLSINPTRKTPDPEQAITLQRDSTKLVLLLASSYDDVEILKLNTPHLARARFDVQERLGKRIRELKPNQRKRFLTRRLASATTPSSDGLLPPFAGIIERYARKKLRQYTSKP
jgi:hypothetical protein